MALIIPTGEVDDRVQANPLDRHASPESRADLAAHVPEPLRTVLAFGRSRFAPARFRLTVAAFNLRAQRVYTRAGFRMVGRFRRGDDSAAPEFLLMVEDEGVAEGNSGGNRPAS
jgi:hypothetical protein